MDKTADSKRAELKSSLSDISFPQLIEIPSLAILPSDYRNVLTEVAKVECDARIEQNKKIAASGPSREPICTHIKNPAVCLFCFQIAVARKVSFELRTSLIFKFQSIKHCMPARVARS
jgi:hypothetical protein